MPRRYPPEVRRQVIASKTDHGAALDGIIGASEWMAGQDAQAAVAQLCLGDVPEPDRSA